MRRNLSPEQLLSHVLVDGANAEQKCRAIHKRITMEIQKECSRESKDEELFTIMQTHLSTIEKLLPPPLRKPKPL